MSVCAHEFTCTVDIFIFDNAPGNGAVEISGHCLKCAAPLLFQGPRGAGGAIPLASVARDQLRAPVTIGHDATFAPRITMTIDGPELRPERRH